MAQKMKSTLLTMSLILLLITGIASALLAYVYTLTKEPIEEAAKQKKVDALSLVLPDFDNQPIDMSYKISSDGDSLVCYIGEKDGKTVGVAIETYTLKGFSGKFTVMVGFKPDGTIINTKMLKHQETPGLGDKAEKEKSDWSNQFNDINPDNKELKVTKDGGTIDAITAATISSRAYADAVNRAYNSFMKNVKPNLTSK